MDERTLPPTLLQIEAQIIITGPFLPNETGAEIDVVMPDALRGVVYAFAEGDEENAGAFLGRFHVDSTPTPTKFRDNEGNEKNGFLITLITIDPISEAESEQILNATQSRWAVYLTPPVDRIAGIFDQLTEADKEAISEELRERFLPRPMPELTEEDKEGASPEVLKIWQAVREKQDDPESESAYDFSATLDWLYKRRSAARRDIITAESYINTNTVAAEKANAENEKLEKDGTLEEKRAKAMNGQREAVKTLSEQYGTEINNIALQIEKLQALQEAYVEKIEEYQQRAVTEIEERTKEPEPARTATRQP
jgi:hypothetical protein